VATEFTGERVVPGQVDADLWNEHFARYAFAARLAKRKRVLDIGCGTGYGTCELATGALRACGLDPSTDALHYATEHYAGPNLCFARGSCEALPFASGSFDLLVSFEVIEHVEAWQEALREARRVLAPAGQLIISTPNKLYYAESRKISGPNPYHHHEFDFDEFRAVLQEMFPHVRLFLQNHADGIVLRPVTSTDGPAAFASNAEVRIEAATSDAAEAHFFLAVCALSPQTGAPTYIYLPTTANVLREREQHILYLEQELLTKDHWLERTQQEHQQLVELHREQTDELNQRTEWAHKLDEDLREASKRIGELQDELAHQQQRAQEVVLGYEEAIGRLERQLDETAREAREVQARLESDLAQQCAALDAKVSELNACVDLLHAAEATVEERTRWAQSIGDELQNLRARFRQAEASKWMRLGRSLGLGPELRNL
jgi:SAM-dependent methyltransferase